MSSEIITPSISDQGSDSSSGSISKELLPEGVLLRRQELREHFLGRLLEERYLIEAFINGGGSSLVFSATDIKTLAKVAVKVLIKDLDSAGRSIKRFNQEARTTRFLRHKNIVEIYSYGVEANHAYFVMELLTGGSLEDWLAANQSLGQEASLEVYGQIARALAYAHREGVIHRDLKPSNILFADQERKVAKLVDFGLSTRLSWDYSNDAYLTPTGDVFGTTLYISPEQSRGARTDQRADIYSLGCVFYECLCGKPPFTGANAIEIVLKHQKDELVPVNSAAGREVCSPELQVIVAKMLRKSTRDRYKSFEAILCDLEALAEGRFNSRRYEKAEASKEVSCTGGTGGSQKGYQKESFLKDYTRQILVLAVTVTILFLLLGSAFILATDENARMQVSDFFYGVGGVRENDEPSLFEQTKDPDLLAIKSTIADVIIEVSRPEIDPALFTRHFTKRWKDNDYALTRAVWAKEGLQYSLVLSGDYLDYSAFNLLSIDRSKGVARVEVGTENWLKSGGPEVFEFDLVRDAERGWLIDSVLEVGPARDSDKESEVDSMIGRPFK